LHHAGQLGIDGNVVAVVSGGNLAMDTLAALVAPATPATPAAPATPADR
jgi:hypothetical protein